MSIWDDPAVKAAGTAGTYKVHERRRLPRSATSASTPGTTAASP